ncbi:MAG: TRAP transporter fused permease subunit [Proteobacteria bacterium]|nr:TRAP transporter fused permease subunit [Pseudomonadota bacterium]MBU1452717.1 TRAP transporter fused permease subunit [Pseudomonadota bacterium]MBU2467857.1 TRAP transporter fused permease subunit [Pseudomonadota bacterium]MBU2519408.1 TRAP transporter fused permease subunit [Pseudomonadota bacterium]
MAKEPSKASEFRDWLIKVLSVFYVAYVGYFIITYFASPQQVVVGLIALSAIFVTLNQVRLFTARLGAWLSGGIATLLVLIWVFIGLYFYLEYPTLLYERDGANNTLDFVLAGLLIILTIFYTYVCYGLTIPLVVTAFLIYGILGQFFPGFLYHPGMRLERLLQETSLSFSGIFGMLPQVGLKYVAIFIIFAGFVRVFGGMDYVIDSVRRLSRRNERMIPQISVLASMIFGSFTGSAAANLAGTGAFTIPLMKNHGIPPKVAGGIEATASAGSQIMPPIMGTTAFVIAEYLGIQYLDVVVAGVFPAILFYFSIMVAVYIITLLYMKPTDNIKRASEKDQDVAGQGSLADGLCLALGMGTIFYLLIMPKLDAMTCGFYGVAVYLAAQILLRVAVPSRRKPAKELADTVIDGAVRAAAGTAPIILLLACLGIVVKILVGSGLSTRLSSGLVELGGNQMVPVILLVMLVCILFGMAVTTVAAYILTIIVAAPALQSFGIPELATHFAIFYFAMLSAITPPVAGIIPIACGLSGSGYMETAWEAMKLGVAKYLLPFCFIFQPNLLKLDGDGLVAFIRVGVGIIAITIGLQIKYPGIMAAGLRVLLLVLGFFTLFSSHAGLAWGSMVMNVIVISFMAVLWKKKLGAKPA